MGTFIGGSNPFTPPVSGITLGTAGQVLTSNGPSSKPTFQNATGGGGIGTYLSYVSPAGVSNNVNPPGFGTGVGRLDVDTTAGAATFTGLAAGADGQLLIFRVIGGNNLILNAFDAGSLAANRFASPANFALVQWNAIILCYYAGTVNNWVIT